MFEYPVILSPVALSFLGIDIRWYSLSYIIGFLYFFWFAKKNKTYFKLNLHKIDNLILYNFLGIIIGGRLGYFFFYSPVSIFNDPISLFKIWEGGMSFHGAFIGCSISIIYFVNKTKSSLYLITDLFSLTVPLGIFLGRIANFTNKELLGKETNFWLSIKYPDENFYRHLSQFYESFFEGLLPFVLLNILFFLHKPKSGIITSLFLIIYGFSRIIIEFVREPDSQIGFIFLNISLGQILCIPILLIGLLVFFNVNSKRNR